MTQRQTTDNLRPPIPAKVFPGQRLKADTVNQLGEAIGIRELRDRPQTFVDGIVRPPWEVFRAGTPSGEEWRVKAGTYTRNGIILTAAETTLSLASNSVNTVYLELDDDETPTTVTVQSATSGLPAEAAGENRYFKLAEITLDASGNLTKREFFWFGGDIDNTSKGGGGGLTPDHDSPNSGTDPYRSSLEKNPEAGDHFEELQLYNLQGVATVSSTPANGRPLAFAVYESDGDDARGALKWVSPDSDKHDSRVSSNQRSIQIFSTGARPTINGVNQDDEQLQLYEFDTGSTSAIDGSNDSFIMRKFDGGSLVNVGYANTSQAAAAIEPNLNPDNFASQPKHSLLDYPVGANSAAKAACVDHTGRHPSCDSPSGSADANTKTFTFTNTTAAGASAGVIKVTGGAYFGAGVYALKGAAANAGYFENGSFQVTLGDGTGVAAGFTDSVRSVGLCNGVDAVFASGDVRISGTSGTFVHNGNGGISPGNFSGGILHAQEPAINTINVGPPGGARDRQARIRINAIIAALQNSGITL